MASNQSGNPKLGPPEISHRLECRDETHFLSLFAKTVGVKGILLPSIEPAPLGTRLILRLLSQSGATLVLGDAVVTASDQTSGMTVHFTALTPDSIKFPLAPPSAPVPPLRHDVGKMGTHELQSQLLQQFGVAPYEAQGAGVPKPIDALDAVPDAGDVDHTPIMMVPEDLRLLAGSSPTKKRTRKSKSKTKIEILRRLGVGGMAEVFLVRQLGLQGFEKYVVLKKILPKFAESESFINMLFREARSGARLTHSNIVQVYDLGDFEGTPYITMEYVRGPDLRRLMLMLSNVNKGLPIEHSLRIVAEIAAGLEYAHRYVDPTGVPYPVLHRDVSPANILISLDGAIKLSDFGIAKVIGEIGADSTPLGNGLRGKLAYIPPESIMGERLDERSDVYSLGVVLFELLTGTSPFHVPSHPPAATINAILAGTLAGDPKVLNPWLGPEIIEVMMKAMATLPGNRYQSAGEFGADIETAMIGAGLRSTPDGVAKYFKQELGSSLDAEMLGENFESSNPWAPFRTPASVAAHSSGNDTELHSLMTNPRLDGKPPSASALSMSHAPAPPKLPEPSLASSQDLPAAGLSSGEPLTRHWATRRRITVGSVAGVVAIFGLLSALGLRSFLARERDLDEKLLRADQRVEAGRLSGSSGDEALDVLLVARSLAPKDRRVAQRLEVLAQVLERLGDRALLRKDSAEALSHYDAAAQAGPSRALTLKRRGAEEALISRATDP